MSDARVKAAFNSRRAGTLSLEWELEQVETPIRQYKTIKSVFDAMPIQDIISEILTAVFYGYQINEVLWKKIGGMILPEQLVPKPARWFRYSDINELRYLTKRNMITGEPVPERKFIVARHKPSYGNPYGESLGSAVYWPVKFRHTGFRFYTTFVEKYGTPWIKASYPLGTREARVAEMLDVLNKTIQDGVIAFPEEMKVEAMPVGGESGSNSIFNQFIELCNVEIYMAILGQNLTSEVKGGSYAAAKVHGAVREDLILEDKQIVENVFNTLIDWIYHYNFTGDVRPKFKLISSPTPNKDDGQMAVYLSQAGVKFNKEYFENRFNLLDTEFDMKSPEEMAPALAGKTPFGVPSESAGDSAGGDNAIHEGMQESKDPSRNTQTSQATERLRSKGAYGSYGISGSKK